MPRLDSHVNRKDADFVARDEHHRQLAADLREKLEQTALGGPEKSRAKHEGRGKLLPRERVRTLLDPGSPFWRSRRWRPTACTKMPRPARA
jgi:3-methylcrotonyl-CoA carboxylase beta subunit